MKKYYFFIVFCAAALLAGCNRDNTATVIYTDVPSPLTQMTLSESLPPETYSEYMATYTSETDTSSEAHYFSMIMGNGIYADTAVTAPPADHAGGMASLKRDTAIATSAATVPDTEITNEAEEIVTPVPNVSETDISEPISETTSSDPSETSVGYTLARPKADTGISTKATEIAADTSVSEALKTEFISESETSE